MGSPSITPQMRGYGLIEEVIKRMVDYAFDELKLKKLVAETRFANKRSCDLMLKVGMSLEQIVTRFGSEQYIFSVSR